MRRLQQAFVVAGGLRVSRIAVGIEYDGSAYAGWQAQGRLPTIQHITQIALSRVAGEPVTLVCAGRTDAGVHAYGQVAHFDTRAIRSTRGWVLGANSELPANVNVSWAAAVPAHFHARYCAEARTYRYLILNRLARSALLAQRAAWVHRPLDHERMAQAAPALLGEHDFSAFRSSECQARSPIRRMERLSVERRGDWVLIEATANAFLHHMMRNITGLLIAIGRADAPPSWAREVLEGRDRTRNAATAAAAGLYLVSVRYPAAFALPAACPPEEPAPDRL
ncbi:MAG: tRNA pseudouridine(38-40) synthase TruA [Gammaproteobacteria bacterium]|nr:MAG: tRNA pseudouridine(38-40) synthase TruA [Gammaproteobacteria bacterium]